MKLGRPRKKYEFEIDENGCFNCISHARGKWGHCITSVFGEPMGIYKHIYIECFGEVPEGMVVRHKCDNGSCINPEHLELGTEQDNKDDMVKRGRSNKGERHHNTKVTKEIAYFIKNDIEHTAQELSNKFGIQVRQVMRIRSGERWGDIETKLPIEELQKLRKQRKR
jgi:hypothetical protein